METCCTQVLLLHCWTEMARAVMAEVNVFTIETVSSPLNYGGVEMLSTDSMAATSKGMLETL